MGQPGPTPSVTPEDILGVFSDREDALEPLSAPEVADALNCSRKTAYNKLVTLRERGQVASKKVGARSRVWWIPESVTADSDDSPAWQAGFGAFAMSDSDFGEYVREEHTALNEDLAERDHDLSGQ
jgi:hypothetical protein